MLNIITFKRHFLPSRHEYASRNFIKKKNYILIYFNKIQRRIILVMLFFFFLLYKIRYSYRFEAFETDLALERPNGTEKIVHVIIAMMVFVCHVGLREFHLSKQL